MDYKSLQIIKHALQHYIKRGNATDKEIEEEKCVLNNITENVNDLKQKYGIK